MYCAGPGATENELKAVAGCIPRGYFNETRGPFTKLSAKGEPKHLSRTIKKAHDAGRKARKGDKEGLTIQAWFLMKRFKYLQTTISLNP